MSSERVELVKRLQPDGLDLAQVFSEGVELVSEDEAALFDDAFEVRFINRGSESDELLGRGPDGLVAAWRDWLTPWRSYRLDVEEIIDAGDNVVTFVHVEAQTERDGVAVQHSPAAIWRFRGGKVVAIHFYLDRAEALEAAGLPSEEFAQKSG
jgi:ketosteroid isomerase-like protein